MTIHLSLPGRINILGNPGDANEGDFGVLSAAIEIRAHATINAGPDILLEMSALDGAPAHFKKDTLPLPYNGEYDLLKGAINRLAEFSPEFSRKLSSEGFHLSIHSDVPRQSGMGGSSLFILLTLAALREQFQLDHEAQAT